MQENHLRAFLFCHPFSGRSDSEWRNCVRITVEEVECWSTWLFSTLTAFFMTLTIVVMSKRHVASKRSINYLKSALRGHNSIEFRSLKQCFKLLSNALHSSITFGLKLSIVPPAVQQVGRQRKVASDIEPFRFDPQLFHQVDKTCSVNMRLSFIC